MARVERLGKYELLRHLASGGMARVYLARVDGMGGFARHMVLKTVRPERTDDNSYVSMFLDEARLIATLHHQHVAQVYDVGVAADGTYYMAMEYLHGETMRHVLERARDLRQRLPLDFSLTVVAAAAAGLHHAHERRGPDGRPLGIVHRDVTPSNVIAGYDGSVKLIDFGIAKAAERSTHTKTGFIKGKAGYMAPEQALGHPVDRRADVFSLGVMLYELTTQTRAFPAASELEVAHRIVRGEVTPPSIAVSGYPSELEDVVMSALARDADERFGDADALAHAVNYAASHLGVGLGPAAVSRVLGQLFGSKPEPWLTEESDEEELDYSRTGDTASLLDSRPLLATSREAVGFARGTRDSVVRLETESAAASPPPPAPPPAPKLEVLDDDDDEGDEMPTVKFVALDEAEIIIEHGPARGGVRVLAPLPGLTEPPPPARVIAGPPPPPPRSPMGSQPPPFARTPAAPLPVPPAVSPMASPKPGTLPSRARTEEVMAFSAFEAKARRNRSLVPLLAGAALALVVVIVLIKVMGDRDDTVTPAQPLAADPSSATVTPPVGPPAPAASAKPAETSIVTIRVTTTPVDATVMLGSERLGRTPLTIERPRQAGPVWLKVRKKGHSTRKIEVDLGADVSWDISLPKSD